MSYQIVSGAYGRDYKSASAAVKDWLAGKDFRCYPQGCYTSVRDWHLDDQIELRYNKLADLTIITVGREWVDDTEDESYNYNEFELEL
jgi:hypothetical protein